MKKRSKARGFTIVELVIVIAVIAILAAILIPAIGDVVDKAKDSKAIQEAKNAYTQYMIDNAADAEMARYYVFKADKKRFVAILDGAPQGVFSSRDEAVRSLLDDPETYIYKTTIKNLFAVNKGTVVVDNDGNNTSTFDEIKLITGDHYLGGNTTDTTVASSEVKVYLRGGEGLTLLDRENYDVEIIATNPLIVDGTPISLYSVAHADGWYGVVIRKIDGSAFNFNNVDSDLLSDYVRICHYMINNPSIVPSLNLTPSVISMYTLYLHEGDVIKLKEEYKDSFECHMKKAVDTYYDINIPTDGTTVITEGKYSFILKSTQNYILYSSSGINLYDYVTIESQSND